jgi:hypothetical protein
MIYGGDRIVIGYRLEFKYWWGQDFSLIIIQTGSGAHLASYPMDIRGSFPGSKVPEM